MSKEEKLKAVALGMVTAGMETFELDKAAAAVATTVPSAWRTLQRWLCLGLDSVSNQVPRPRLGPFIFGSVCRERGNCANMLNIQI